MKDKTAHSRKTHTIHIYTALKQKGQVKALHHCQQVINSGTDRVTLKIHTSKEIISKRGYVHRHRIGNLKKATITPYKSEKVILPSFCVTYYQFKGHKPYMRVELRYIQYGKRTSYIITTKEGIVANKARQ